MGGLLAFGMLAALSALQSVVLMGVLSLFLALGLNPAVEWFTRRGAPRGLAVAIVALTLVALLVLGAWAVLPLLTEQVNALVLSFPAYLQGLRENPSVADLDAQFQLINRASQALTSGAWVEGMFGGILGAGVAIVNVLFSAFVTLVLTLWFLAFLPGIKNTIYQLAPASRRPRVRYLAGEVFRRIGGYMSGLFLVVSLAAGSAFIFLNLVGLGSYSLALAVVVAGFAFIPLVGPTIAMLIVAVVAFSTSVTTGVITVVFFLVYQQIDAYLIQPRIFQRSVNVPGPLIVIAALSGGILFGIPGALIAIPTVASALLIYREVLIPALDRA
ncbi:AI-2E family transporter [Propioniciclava flava]|uniref:AI-2E family transporter n=1 Tax=Propioniciclava flava TaxID=2072026 RepID=A0A4V1Q7P6_9ACTN|nr:AI-2E family transporter [Propioniciclava flava]